MIGFIQSTTCFTPLKNEVYVYLINLHIIVDLFIFAEKIWSLRENFTFFAKLDTESFFLMEI